MWLPIAGLVLCTIILGVSCQRIPTGVGVGTPGVTRPGVGPRPGVFQNPMRTPIGPAGARLGRGPFGGFGFPMGPTRMMPPLTPMSMMMASLARNPNNYRYGTCTFNDTDSTVRGRADFRQFVIGEGRQQVQVRLQLTGLPQAGGDIERGLHIHEFGDIGDGCARVGPHFNPNQTPHGSQRNFAYLRHVGDLGNIRQSNDGLVSTQFLDQVISLDGPNNVVGRSMVLKVERDDLGTGQNRESQVHGNTYNPLACCVVGRTTARNWYNPMSAEQLQTMAATGLMPEATIDPFNNPVNVPFNPATPGTPGFGQPGLTVPGGVPTGGFPGGFGQPGVGFGGLPAGGFPGGVGRPGVGFGGLPAGAFPGRFGGATGIGAPIGGRPGVGFGGAGAFPGGFGRPGVGFGGATGIGAPIGGRPGVGFGGTGIGAPIGGRPGVGFGGTGIGAPIGGQPGVPGTGIGVPGTGVGVPGVAPGTGVQPGVGFRPPGVGVPPGIGLPGVAGRPGFPTPPGFPGATFGRPGFGTPGFGPTGAVGGPAFGTGFGVRPGFGPTGGFAQPGFNPAATTGFTGTGSLTQPGFGATGTGGLTQSGFGATGTGLTQPGFGATGGLTQPGFGGTGGLTQPGFGGSGTTGGLTQPGFNPAAGTAGTAGFTGGLTQPGFNAGATAGNTGTSSAIGTGTTFNFNQQG